MWFDAEMKTKDITDGVKGYSCLTGSPSYVFCSVSMQVKLALFFSVIYDILHFSCLFPFSYLISFMHLYAIVNV